MELVGSWGMVCWSRDGKGVSFSERIKRMVWGDLFCYCVRVQLLDTIVIRMYVCVHTRDFCHTRELWNGRIQWVCVMVSGSWVFDRVGK